MEMMYRVGFPGWKFVAQLGWPLKFRVRVHKDESSGTFWAESGDIAGLIVSGSDLAELEREIKLAAHELLVLEMHGSRTPKVEARMEYRSPVPCPA